MGRIYKNIQNRQKKIKISAKEKSNAGKSFHRMVRESLTQKGNSWTKT